MWALKYKTFGRVGEQWKVKGEFGNYREILQTFLIGAIMSWKKSTYYC